MGFLHTCHAYKAFCSVFFSICAMKNGGSFFSGDMSQEYDHSKPSTQRLVSARVPKPLVCLFTSVLQVSRSLYEAIKAGINCF